MSDFLTIQAPDTEVANRLLRQWAQSRAWAGSAEVQRRWEPAELIVHGRNAIRLMKGKHKTELAKLVLMLREHGVIVRHVALRDDAREEYDLIDWARALNAGGGQ